MAPGLIEKFEHEDPHDLADVHAPVSDHFAPARDLPLVDIGQIQLVAGSAHIPSGARPDLVEHPGHPLELNIILGLEVLEGVIDKIIPTGPLKGNIAPSTCCGWVDHPRLGCYLFSKAATLATSSCMAPQSTGIVSVYLMPYS